MDAKELGISQDNYLYNNSAQKNSLDKLILYKKKKILLYINLLELKIYLNAEGGDDTELSFKECVRFIDTRPETAPEWKRKQILLIASKLGFFGV